MIQRVLISILHKFLPHTRKHTKGTSLNHAWEIYQKAMRLPEDAQKLVLMIIDWLLRKK